MTKYTSGKMQQKKIEEYIGYNIIKKSKSDPNSLCNNEGFSAQTHTRLSNKHETFENMSKKELEANFF